MRGMIRLAHVINNLQTGGAEMTLLRLLERIDRSRFEPMVIALIGEGTIGPRLRELDIPVSALGAKRGRVSPLALMRVTRDLKAFQPDVVQAWLYHANLAATMSAAHLQGKPPVAWNIRHSLHDLSRESWLTRRVIRAGARRSPGVAALISNSRVAMEQHESIGFRATRHEVIPNGIDPDAVAPREESRRALRAELGLAGDAFLVGGVGRFHPMKDQATLAEAVGRLVRNDRDAHLVLVGRGCESGGPAESLRASSGLGERLHLLAERRPVAPVLAGLDCLVMSSAWGEGFPNVLAEAMASAVPCVTTDVGDAADILGAPGRVVVPGDAEAMAVVIDSMLKLSCDARDDLGLADRARVVDRYPIETMVQRYQDLWSDLLP